MTIPGRITVGDTDQDKTVQIHLDLPEPGCHILGIDVPVDLGILADRVVIRSGWFTSRDGDLAYQAAQRGTDVIR